jgi:hypothetical protein
MKSHRLKFTTEPIAPAADTPEGYRAAWWRERVLGYSRPQLADALGLHTTTIETYENSQTVPLQYGLACAALQVDRLNRLPFFNEGRFIWPTS